MDLLTGLLFFKLLPKVCWLVRTVLLKGSEGIWYNHWPGEIRLGLGGWSLVKAVPSKRNVMWATHEIWNILILTLKKVKGN